MTTDLYDTKQHLHPTSTDDPTLTELQLQGYRPFEDEADPRPLPRRG